MSDEGRPDKRCPNPFCLPACLVIHRPLAVVIAVRSLRLIHIYSVDRNAQKAFSTVDCSARLLYGLRLLILNKQ